jgi:SAM-dependent methyltransferase
LGAFHKEIPFVESRSAVPSIIRIEKDGGIVEICRNPQNGAFDISLLPARAGLYVPKTVCRTTWPLELIRYVAQRTPFAWICERIARHEHANYVAATLKRHLFSYFPAGQFAGKCLLDFGCGSGASSLLLAGMLPETEVVGVDLRAERIELANQIQSFRGLHNVHFLCSPSSDELPAGLGEFDFVTLCGVYEHLLPNERVMLMPLLWRLMKPGACIFVNRTPCRYFPYEAHSTGLWFVNYLPDKLAHRTVRRFAGRNLEINRSADWNVHLRGGLRGATEKEIIRNLTGGKIAAARILQPCHNGVRDRAGFWLAGTNPKRYRMVKSAIANLFRLTDRLWGTVPSSYLEVAIEKREP